ncbi:MAG: hypothetical protein AAFQ96_02680 [Pseudomonadota bacterium]
MPLFSKDLENRDVRALQDAVEAVAREQKQRNPRLSRAARLHLIDVLSRWSGSALGLIAGAGLYVAIAAGGADPLRAGVWLLMIMAALYTCRRLRSEFRAGTKTASRPFRWRGNYVSALSVLSAAFGAGALLTTHSFVGQGLAVQLSGLILLATIIAAALHIAHGRAAAAIMAPATLFVIAAVWRSAGANLAIFGFGAVSLAAGLILFVVSRQFQASAALRYPRSRILRRNSDLRDELEPGYLSEANAQAG